MSKVRSYWVTGWKHSHIKIERLRYKFLTLSDDEIKELCRKFFRDTRCGFKSFLGEEYDPYWKFKVIRDSRGDLIQATLEISYYDDIDIGLNVFGRCYVQEHMEHQPTSIARDISIDEFLEEYLDDESDK